MPIAFLYILYYIHSRIFAQKKKKKKKKRIQVEKHVCKAINKKRWIIEIDMFQTLVGNICQEIS